MCHPLIETWYYACFQADINSLKFLLTNNLFKNCLKSEVSFCDFSTNNIPSYTTTKTLMLLVVLNYLHRLFVCLFVSSMKYWLGLHEKKVGLDTKKKSLFSHLVIILCLCRGVRCLSAPV